MKRRKEKGSLINNNNNKNNKFHASNVTIALGALIIVFSSTALLVVLPTSISQQSHIAAAVAAGGGLKVEITSPSNGAVLPSSPVTIRGDASTTCFSANVSCTVYFIRSVLLNVDDQPSSIQADISSPSASHVTWEKTLNLSNGPHSITATAIDYGNQTDSQSIRITIQSSTTPPPSSGGGGSTDTTPPDTQITSAMDTRGRTGKVVPDGSATSSHSITFSFSGTDNVGISGFECSLDDSQYTNCSSPQSYSALSSGAHSFQVKAIDAAGNVDQSPATFSWTIHGGGGGGNPKR